MATKTSVNPSVGNFSDGTKWVVAVAATHELRILDGHHRACLAALRGERVSAWVVEV
jgi:hypothetical protein